ncbi:GNAT family N-acetyltransferase [Bartonella sp. LJL80]
MSAETIQDTDRRPRTIDCPVLVTERLVLRQPHVEDMDAIADLANNRRVSAMLQKMPYPYTRKHAAEFILRAVAGELGHCVYAITFAENGSFIGSCSIKDREEGDGLELGYWIGQPYWKNGYATEVVSCLVDAAFRASDIDELYVSCFSANVASRRVILKSGFRFLGTGERHSQVSGLVFTDHFVLERERWLGQHSLCA